MVGNRREGPPYWHKPCGELSEDEGEIEEAKFDKAALMAKVALGYWNTFGDKWIKDTFQKGEDVLHSTFPQKYDAWGPKIPKKYKEPTTGYVNLKAADVLYRSHEALQRCAVGMEQVVDDMKANRDKYANEFKGLENKLKSLLCEVDFLLKKREIKRDIMPDEIRDLANEGERHLRDWIITKDMLNAVEYVRDMASYIHKHGK